MRLGSFDVTVRLPKVGRPRLVTTLSLASTFTTLWITAPIYLPFATVDATLVLSGVGIPFGVGYVTLLLAERKIARDLRKVARPLPESDRYEHVEVRPDRAGVR